MSFAGFVFKINFGFLALINRNINFVFIHFNLTFSFQLLAFIHWNLTLSVQHLNLHLDLLDFNLVFGFDKFEFDIKFSLNGINYLSLITQNIIGYNSSSTKNDIFDIFVLF